MTNPFDVLNEMVARNLDIRLANSDNLTNVRTGKNGFGRVEMAIDNDTAQIILNKSTSGKKLMIFFLYVDEKQYSEIKSELDREAA